MYLQVYSNVPRAMKIRFFDGERNGQNIIVYIVPLDNCVLHTTNTCQTQGATFAPRRTASDMCVSSYGHARLSHATLVIKSRIPCHVFTLTAWVGNWNCSVRRIVFKLLHFLYCISDFQKYTLHTRSLVCQSP